MADFISYWTLQIIKHVPTVTYIALPLAGVLMVVYLTKKRAEAALLAGVLIAYGLSPYLPGW